MNEKYDELKEALKKLIALEKKYDKTINKEIFKKFDLKILNIAKNILISKVAFGYDRSLPSPYCEKAAEEIKSILKKEAIQECRVILLKNKDIESFNDLIKKYQTKCNEIMGRYLNDYFTECAPVYFIA